jgi:phosphatidylinositol-4,5-bisphosphate 3-kinase
MATMAHYTILVMYFVQVVKNVDYFFYLILNPIFTGMTIGVPINEFNEMKDFEVMTFRRNILDVCKSSIEERQRGGKASEALYTYPPDLESSPILPSHLRDKIREMSKYIICIKIMSVFM